MKKIILALSCLVVFGCSKNDNKIDPNRAITFHGEPVTRSMSVQDSIHQLVEYCYEISWKQKGSISVSTNLGYGDTFLDGNGIRRDLENDRIIMSGDYVVFESEWSDNIYLGAFVRDTATTRDVVFTVAVDSVTNKLIDLREVDWFVHHRFYRDTLGYIPNKILIAAQKDIVENYNAENYEACFRIFDTAFIFKPITAARWRALKAAGIE